VGGELVTFLRFADKIASFACIENYLEGALVEMASCSEEVPLTVGTELR